jgi:sodium transport system ATP-binding protein
MIEVIDLVKHYHAADGGIVRAVNGVSFVVQAGEMVGLLGANGAGKTSTLRMLATLLKPTAGTARVAGCDVRHDPVGVRQRLGYVSATTGVPDRLTPREIFMSFGRLHGIPPADLPGRAESLLEQLDLRRCADRPAGRLSSGQRQRVSLGRALVHDPPALVLDEPTNALDVVGARDLLVLLGELRGAGHAILLSTHRLHEIETRCDRFVIIHDGSVVAAGTRQGLVAEWIPGREAELEDAFFAAIAGRSAAPGSGG